MSVEKIFISIGENCLSQGILDRKNIKSVLNPFSWTRSNIDYVSQIVSENFNNFLNSKFLQKEYRENNYTAINLKYTCQNGIFENSVSNYFEFTHHNVVDSIDCLESYIRKVVRFKQLVQSNNEIIFFYHHRVNPTPDYLLLIEKLNNFVCFIQTKRNAPTSCLCFTQKIVKDSSERKVEISKHGNTAFAVFHTLSVWAGSNDDLFFAKVDDDLIDKMFTLYCNMNNH